MLGGCQGTSETAALTETTYYAQITAIDGYNITLAVVTLDNTNADIVSTVTENEGNGSNAAATAIEEDSSHAADAISSATEEEDMDKTDEPKEIEDDSNHAVDAISSATEEGAETDEPEEIDEDYTNTIDATATATADQVSEATASDAVSDNTAVDATASATVEGNPQDVPNAEGPSGEEPQMSAIITLTDEEMTVKVTGKTSVIIPSENGSELGFVSNLAVGDIVLVTMSGDSLKSIAKQVL